MISHASFSFVLTTAMPGSLTFDKRYGASLMSTLKENWNGLKLQFVSRAKLSFRFCINRHHHVPADVVMTVLQ